MMSGKNRPSMTSPSTNDYEILRKTILSKLPEKLRKYHGAPINMNTKIRPDFDRKICQNVIKES